MKKAAATKPARPKLTRSKTTRPKTAQLKTACGKVVINRDRCKGCRLCVEFCPLKVLALDTVLNRLGYHPVRAINPQVCTGCDLCGSYCPDFAIFGVRLSGVEEEADEG